MGKFSCFGSVAACLLKEFAHEMWLHIEDITWLCGDTNFIFKILPALEDKICIPKQPCNVLFTL